MTLHVEDKWVWDFWFARDEADYHIFYLQAPRSLENPDLRHWHTTIGHAISKDLIHWEILPDALVPSKHADVFDNLTVWTGSIIKQDNTWYMFYTGTKREEQGKVQRIGMAISEDLMYWRRHQDNPIMVIDPHWYELLDESIWYEQAWRDPWVFEYDGRFHALITARTNKGTPDTRGVIGYACSVDLLHWEVKPPITKPGEFSYFEVPNLTCINNKWYLIFCVEAEKYSKQRMKRLGYRQLSGTHYMIAEHPLGPFHAFPDDVLLADVKASYYSGKIIQNPVGHWVLLASIQFGRGDGFIGDISDPILIKVGGDGELFVVGGKK